MNDNEIIKAMQYVMAGNDNAKLFLQAIQHAKSEAIKEFAERLTESIYTLGNRVDVDGIVLLNRIVDDIDNLAKEMTDGGRSK